MTCEICGKEIEKSKYLSNVLCSKKCFIEHFWNEHLDETAIIIDGVCYHDGGMKPPGYEGFLGFGGHLFRIQMNDGRIIETNNLWHNGDVPKNRCVKDNAVFLPKQEVCK